MSDNQVQTDPFEGTAQYYSSFRPRIPHQVVDYIASRFNLDGKGTLLDIGCGTGLSTFALAPLFDKTVAFDADLAMLKEAKRREPRGFNIEWQHRSDKDITDTEGPYRLAIACRAFHWMDQYSLLKKLHDILEIGGGIALIGDGSFWTGDEPWQKKVKEIIQSFLGQERRAGKSSYSAPEEPYTTTLKNNNYHDVHHKAIPVVREWDIQMIIGYLYSTSFSAKHLFGEQLKKFEETMKEQLLYINGGSEVFIEHTEFAIQSGIHK